MKKSKDGFDLQHLLSTQTSGSLISTRENLRLSALSNNLSNDSLLPKKVILQNNTEKSFVGVRKTLKEEKQMENSRWKEIFNFPQSILFENPLGDGKYQLPQNEQYLINFQEPLSEQFKGSQCLICAQNFTRQQSFTLSNCQHVIHRLCLKQLLFSNMKQRKFPSHCPYENCAREISIYDIQNLFSNQEFENYQKLKEKSYVEAHSYSYFFCQTPDCEQYVEKKHLISRFHKCSTCETEYCTLCSKPWHHGPCQLRQQDGDFFKFAKKKLYTTCPRCQKLVQKASGCHHIVCICKYQFCYICEKDYKNECQCKHLSFGEHRTLMAAKRKQQAQIAKQELKEKRVQERTVKDKEKEQVEVEHENKFKKRRIFQYKKSRKMIKRDYQEEQE